MRAYHILLENKTIADLEDLKGYISNIESVNARLSDKITKVLRSALTATDSILGKKTNFNEDMTQTYALIDDLQNNLDTICPSGNCDGIPVYRTMKDLLNELVSEVKKAAEKIEKTGYERGSSETKIQIMKMKKELKKKVLDLVKKAEGLDPEMKLEKADMNQTQQAIEAKLMQLVSDIEEREIDTMTLNKFLDLSKEGKIIDMKKLVSTKSGKIDDHINRLPADVQELFNDEFKGSIFSFIPGGTTSGNYGPAEVALAIFGNPANKAAKGDLEVDGEMFELKGSGYKGVTKTGKLNQEYGARLNSKGIGSGTAGWNVLNKQIKKHMPSIKAEYKGDPTQGKPKSGTKAAKLWQDPSQGYLTYTSTQRETDEDGNLVLKPDGTPKMKEKRASRYNFNTKGITALNKEVLGPLGDPAKTMDILLPTFQAIVNGHEKVKDFDSLVRGMINSDGTLDEKKLWKNYSAIAYESYNQEDEVENILFINSTNRNYFIVRSKEDLLDAIDAGEITVKGGITWNDDQQKATPQYIRL